MTGGGIQRQVRVEAMRDAGNKRRRILHLPDVRGSGCGRSTCRSSTEGDGRRRRATEALEVRAVTGESDAGNRPAADDGGGNGFSRAAAASESDRGSAGITAAAAVGEVDAR